MVIERIKNKVLAWKARWMSLSGIILLIKTILATIPNYYISVLKAPRSVIYQIEKLIREFLWKGNLIEEKKIPLISLKNMTLNKGVGGVGLHDISKRNKAFRGKLIWLM